MMKLLPKKKKRSLVMTKKKEARMLNSKNVSSNDNFNSNFKYLN